MASTNRKHNRNRTKSPSMQRYKAENRLAKNKARRAKTQARKEQRDHARSMERGKGARRAARKPEKAAA